MKIKIGFVTNSSSASFMLLLKMDGYMPFQDIPNLRKFYKELGYKVKTLIKYGYDRYNKLQFEIPAEEQDLIYTLESEEIDMYDEKKEEVAERRRISIVGKNTEYNNKASLENTIVEAGLLIQHLVDTIQYEIKKDKFQFSVRIEPTDFRGDGWNGDAMGPYQQITEAIMAETKFGQIVLKKNRVNFRLYDLNGNLVERKGHLHYD